MNKYVKIAIVIAIIVAVFLLSFLATGKKQVEFINNEEYSEIINEGGFVYYGTKDSEDALTDIAKESDIKISILDSSENKTNKLKENTLYEYKDGKMVYKNEEDLNSYKFKKSLAEEGIYKSYITVTFDEYKEIIKSDGYNFMFIGSATCSYCDKFKESIKESLTEHNYAIYYLDIAEFSEEQYNELVKTDKYMQEKEWGTPLNLLYKDGKRVKELKGYVDKDELVKFLKENKVI